MTRASLCYLGAAANFGYYYFDVENITAIKMKGCFKMLKFMAKKKAEKILEVVVEFSKIFVDQPCLYPSGNGDVNEVKCLLVGVSCFLITGFSRENDVAL